MAVRTLPVPFSIVILIKGLEANHVNRAWKPDIKEAPGSSLPVVQRPCSHLSAESISALRLDVHVRDDLET